MSKIVYVASSIQEWNISKDGSTEEYNMGKLADKIAAKLKKYNLTVYRNQGSWSLKQVVTHANETDAKIYISNHSNAGGGEGTEIYYHYKTKYGDNLARDIYKYLAPVTIGKDRGVKSDKILYTNGLYELRETKMPACLIEHFFHDNKKDLDDFYKNIDNFANAVVKGILKYLNITPEISWEIKYYNILNKYTKLKKDLKDLMKKYDS